MQTSEMQRSMLLQAAVATWLLLAQPSKAQGPPDLRAECNDGYCFCTVNGLELTGTRTSDTLLQADFDANPLECVAVSLEFTLRVSDNGTLGRTAFNRSRADELAALLGNALQHADGYVQCTVDKWSVPVKPTVLDGFCAAMCVQRPPKRCESLVNGVNASFQVFEAFYPLESNRLRRLGIRSRSISESAGLASSFRVESSKLITRPPTPSPSTSPSTATASTAAAAKATSTAAKVPEAEYEPIAAPMPPQTVLSDPRRALAHPGVLVALGAAALLLLSLSVLLILFTVKRVRTRDRGSYTLDDAHRKAPLLGNSCATHNTLPHGSATLAPSYGYPSPPAREFYA